MSSAGALNPYAFASARTLKGGANEPGKNGGVNPSIPRRYPGFLGRYDHGVVNRIVEAVISGETVICAIAE
jgi:hypothetical protein